MTPTTLNQPDLNTPVEPVFTLGDLHEMERDKRRARLLVTLQTIAAILTILFFFRALLRND